MESNKEVNVVMSATDKKIKNSIILDITTNECGIIYNNDYKYSGYKPQHLYFTSDEETIKKGDWVLCCNDIIEQVSSLGGKTMVADEGNLQSYNKYTKNWEGKTIEIDIGHSGMLKKIIATTNPEINLPKPSQAFIEAYIREYNKGNVIKKVMVEYDNLGIHEDSEYFNKILRINSYNEITTRPIKDNWTREEVIQLIKDAINETFDTYGVCDKDVNEWIKDNL